ncbi:arginine--tRNA ligase [Patescibacteria group bacterium]|nr:arginine--tRNA ligase [Patescibacteria group bacterium]MDE1946946.1 arginine--tRNA ligase [Patescibacteria group bacterium]MDE2011207.1 arginine--tRNA ligase [Patescibacteria group bacterium]MDE2233497.1 arginine--tRNA ligase [Patescibacteria group bacterium]
MKDEDNSLVEYRTEVDKTIDYALKRLKDEKTNRKYIQYSSYFSYSIRDELAGHMNEFGIADISAELLKIDLPPPHIEADLTMSVFEYCKNMRTSPDQLAKTLSEHIDRSTKKILIKSASFVNGYVNLILDRESVFKRIVIDVNKLSDNYGKTDLYQDKIALIDFSSPNIAKPFGVGHLRSTVIGYSLAKIYEATGYSVIRDNHLGDWGTQFGALIYAYRQWGDDAVIEKDPIEELKNLYVRFNEEASENPVLKDEARKLFSLLEKGDNQLIELWKKFRALSLAEFQKTYEVLGVRFDMMLGESYYTSGSDEVIKDLVKRGLAKTNEDGAVVVEDLDGLPSFLLRKSDGSTLYVMRDVLTLIHRKKIFHPDAIVYVVGSEQQLNFKQLFALCEKAGYSGSTKLCHVNFGLVLVNGQKMATRKGTLVNLEDVLNQSIDKAKKIMLEKNEVKAGDIDYKSRIIGTSAVIYNDLKQNRNSNIEFDWEKMLSLESGSAVYLQYTYARIASILEKAGYNLELGVGENLHPEFKDDIEFKLAIRIAFFPDIILRALENNMPHTIATFLEELAAEFNRFYADVPVLKTDNANLRTSRLALVSAVGITIKNALSLLNIPALSKI